MEYARTPERTTDMDLSIVPISATGCPTDLATLLMTGVAGAEVTIPVHLPGDDDGGGGGACGGGLEASTLTCTPIGRGGVAYTCVSAAEYESFTGQSLPNACAPAGTTACLDTESGVLVRPCCPGLTCAVGSACGGGSVVGGTCI